MSNHEKMRLKAEIAVCAERVKAAQAANDLAQSEWFRRPEAYSGDRKFRLLVILPEFETLPEAQAYLRASVDLRAAKAALREVERAYAQAA